MQRCGAGFVGEVSLNGSSLSLFFCFVLFVCLFLIIYLLTSLFIYLPFLRRGGGGGGEVDSMCWVRTCICVDSFAKFLLLLHFLCQSQKKKKKKKGEIGTIIT